MKGGCLEEGDIGLYIILVPRVLLTLNLIRWHKNFLAFYETYWLKNFDPIEVSTNKQCQNFIKNI